MGVVGGWGAHEVSESRASMDERETKGGALRGGGDGKGTLICHSSEPYAPPGSPVCRRAPMSRDPVLPDETQLHCDKLQDVAAAPQAGMHDGSAAYRARGGWTSRCDCTRTP